MRRVQQSTGWIRTGRLRRGAVVLALAGAALAAGCGSDGSSSGTGGTPGSGGATGGATGAQGGGPGAGGSTGGTTTSPGVGGASGGGGSALAGAGGSTALGDGGRIGSGGRGGNGGNSVAGGASGGGAPGTGGIVARGGSDAGVPGTGGKAGGGGTTERPDAAAGTGGSTDAAAATDSGQTTAVPSAGCGNKSNPQSGRFNLTVGSASREYIIKLPDNYDTNHPYRLVFGFHGAKYNDDWVATGKAPDGGTALSGPFFGIESEAAGSAIFVAPQASGGWSANDLPFVDAMVEQFEAQLCIDESRIFSVGFSMGAIMTITLACNRSEVFRAVAPMSGSLPSPCPTGQHIAYWAAHGTSDSTIRISEGQAARDEFVKRNRCGTQTSAADTNNCVTYQGCDTGYPVTWCTFAGAHDPAPFAGPAIWKFLAPL